MFKKMSESGQSIVVVTVAILGLFALAALIIDGGSLYLNRRNAQTAADAAALAGARELCVEQGTNTDVQNVVNDFAVTQNGATAVENVSIDTNALTVGVQVRLDTPSFFATIFGTKTDTVRATATAGCFAPAVGQNVLPVAWSCQPPGGSSSSSNGCTIYSIPWSIFNGQLVPRYKNQLGECSNRNCNNAVIFDEGDDVNYQSYTDSLPTNSGIPAYIPYIIMDNSTFDPTSQCLPPFGTNLGGLNCDYNNDGIMDLSGGGNRGWLSLDGSGGASNLSTWITTGFPSPITLPQWFPEDTGSITSVFNQAKGVIEFKVVYVPVYNAFCPNTTAGSLSTDCASLYQSGDLITPSTGNNTFDRIPGFAPFVVTCISAKPNQYCPVKNLAGLTGPSLSNTPTMEGYFISGNVGGTGINQNGFNLGVYVISLIK